MKRIALSWISAVAMVASPLALPAAEPRIAHDILGIELAMPKADVEKRLQTLGKFVRNERKRQEIWEIRDDRYSHLIVGFDANGQLRFITAVAREDKDARRVRYAEIGDPEMAHQAGDPTINNFNFEWAIPDKKGIGPGVAHARGRDPEFLTTLSLKRVGESESERVEE